MAILVNQLLKYLKQLNMEIREILGIAIPILQIALTIVCWGYMIHYVRLRLKEKANENKAN